MSSCYVGCSAPTVVTHAPLVHAQALAFTGFDSLPWVVLGIVAITVGGFLTYLWRTK
jgi:hypothetical protein